MLSLALAGVAWTAGLVGDRGAFVYWLLALYWASLAAVVVGMVSVVRSAAAANAGHGSDAGRT
jgi:hypothetical protein